MTAYRPLAVATLLLAAGCSMSTMQTDLGISHPASGEMAVGDLMSDRDRAALADVAQRRSTGGGPVLEGYRIGPDDLLDVRIPRLMDDSTSSSRAAAAAQQSSGGSGRPPIADAPVYQNGLRVSSGGDITVPLLGTVHAAGKTPQELQAEIAQRLREGEILRTPQVSVEVIEYRSRVVAVVGSVERPGLYPLTRPGASLADFIWAAGGPSKDSGRIVQFAPAPEGGGAKGPPIRVDLEVLLGALANGPGPLNPPARPGDVVTIAPAGNVQVDGWVDKPGSYPVTRGLTLSGAVAAAGGQLFPADRQGIAITRTLGPGEQHVFRVDLDRVRAGAEPDFPITDGDVIQVSASAARLFPYVLYEVAKEMVRVGGTVALF